MHVFNSRARFSPNMLEAETYMYQAFAQEHPAVTFSLVVPVAVNGSDPPREVTIKGLELDAEARRCIQAVDETISCRANAAWLCRMSFLLAASRKYKFSA